MQHHATFWIQQRWTMIHQHVLSVWPRLNDVLCLSQWNHLLIEGRDPGDQAFPFLSRKI